MNIKNEEWIGVKWSWKGCTEGSMSNVHIRWIQDDSARGTAHPNYSDDKLVIDYDSVVGSAVISKI